MPSPTTFTTSAPSSFPPAGACDCHTHVFGPVERYPFSPKRTYTPPDALPSDAAAMLAVLGIDRVVLVQASVYGLDNRCLLDGLSALGPRARGVVALSPNTTVSDLEALHRSGVRGVRINIASGHDRPFDSIVTEMSALSELISPLGWHLELFVDPYLLPSLRPVIDALGTKVVIDHMGMVPANKHRENPAFSALLSMLATENSYIKVSGSYRVATEVGHNESLQTMARTLIETRPDRILWGSDWPHTPPHGRDVAKKETVLPFRRIDPGSLLEMLDTWTPDAETRQRILVDNPARIYDFT